MSKAAKKIREMREWLDAEYKGDEYDHLVAMLDELEDSGSLDTWSRHGETFGRFGFKVRPHGHKFVNFEFINVSV